MKDIETRDDIFAVMKEFYTRMFADEKLGYIFTDVAQIKLEDHLPSLTGFWENMILKQNGYNKNVMEIHKVLNLKQKLLPLHFERWLMHFNQTIDSLYSGERANDMKSRAFSIAGVMQHKLLSGNGNV